MARDVKRGLEHADVTSPMVVRAVEVTAPEAELAGVISLIGSSDGPPVAPGILLADFSAGSLLAAVAALAGLYELRRSGRGQFIDLSMHEAVVHTMARFLVPYFEGAVPARRGGDFLTGAAPWYAVYAARDDRYVSVGAVEDHFYAALCRGLGLESWEARQWDEVSWPQARTAFADAFRTRDRDDWVDMLGADCCVAPVFSIDEVATDPHLRERGVISREGNRLRLGPIAPVRGARTDIVSDVPGDSTTRVLLSELGYSDDDIAALERRGIVGSTASS